MDGDGNWIDLPAGTATQTINQGQTLSFKGNLTPNSSNGIGTFTINKKCNLEGNCMSMLFGDDAANNYSLDGKLYAFYRLFKNCTTIIEISEAFLPATTLSGSCYQFMFINCTSLTTAPELPATTLSGSCYNNMFNGCSNLNYIKMLATDISATSCLINWVFHVSSTGTFVKNANMTSLPTGSSGIPEGWTVLDSPTIDLTFPLSLSMDEPDTDLQKELFRYLRIKYRESSNLIPIDEEIYVDGMLLDQYMFTPCSNISTFGCDYIQFHSTGDGIDIYLTPDGTWF